MQGPGVNEGTLSLHSTEHSVRGQGLDEAVDSSKPHPHDRSYFADSQELDIVDREGHYLVVFLQAHFHFSLPQPKHLAIPYLHEH